MDSERPPNLRTVGLPGEQAAATGAPLLASGMAINATAELVVDLLAATGLVAPDKLALVRGRAGQGSLAQAIVDEGVAPPEGIARSLAVRYQIALVDLALAGVDKEAAEQVPLHVLERVVAIPYALENGTLRIAVADPGNLHGWRVPRRRSVRGRCWRKSTPTSASARRTRTTTSSSTMASPTRRSSGSSTPSSSRLPRTAPPTFTSSRRWTRSWSVSGSTACCTRCSGSRSG